MLKNDINYNNNHSKHTTSLSVMDVPISTGTSSEAVEWYNYDWITTLTLLMTHTGVSRIKPGLTGNLGFPLSCLQKIPGLFQDLPRLPKTFFQDSRCSPAMSNYRRTAVTYPVYSMTVQSTAKRSLQVAK